MGTLKTPFVKGKDMFRMDRELILKPSMQADDPSTQSACCHAAIEIRMIMSPAQAKEEKLEVSTGPDGEIECSFPISSMDRYCTACGGHCDSLQIAQEGMARTREAVGKKIDEEIMPKLVDPDGKISPENIRETLIDFAVLQANATEVYRFTTDGFFQSPNIYARAVKQKATSFFRRDISQKVLVRIQQDIAGQFLVLAGFDGELISRKNLEKVFSSVFTEFLQ